MLNASCGKIGSSPIINSKFRDLQQAALFLQEELGEITQISLFISCRDNNGNETILNSHLFPSCRKYFNLHLTLHEKDQVLQPMQFETHF